MEREAKLMRENQLVAGFCLKSIFSPKLYLERSDKSDHHE